MTLKEAFSILKISPTYKKPIVKKAYLAQVKIFHPDVNKNSEGNQIYRINEAYNFIIKSIEEDKKNNLFFHFENAINSENYSSLGDISDDQYSINNDDIIDSLFSSENPSKSSSKLEQVFISKAESLKGIKKNIIDKDTGKEFLLDIPANTLDGQIFIINLNCYEIKIIN